MAVQDLTRIEERLDRAVAGSTTVSDAIGGVLFQNMAEVLEFAKLMSLSDVAVPKHLRGNPGACLRIVTQALEWRMSPYAVADKSYSVNDRIAYESQLIHAVIEARAPLKQRLRCEFEGEGAARVCIATGHIKGEAEPLVVRSPPFASITPKNSPLWKSDPDQQQWYYTSRIWCRRHCPDVLLGIYDREELGEHVGFDRAKDITPKPSIGERLKAKAGQRGFSAQHIDEHTGGKKDAADRPAAEPAVQEIIPPHSSNSDTEAQRADVAGQSPGINSESAPTGDEPGASEEASYPDAVAAAVLPPVDDHRPPHLSSDESQAVAAEPKATSPNASSLCAKYGETLFRATQAKSLKAIVDQFWNANEFPFDDEATKKRIDAIHNVHVKRIKHEIDDKQAMEEIKEIVVVL